MPLARCKSRAPFKEMAVGQNQGYHFGVSAPPILVYFSGDWDVHWGYDLDFDPWPNVYLPLAACRLPYALGQAVCICSAEAFGPLDVTMKQSIHFKFAQEWFFVFSFFWLRESIGHMLFVWSRLKQMEAPKLRLTPEKPGESMWVEVYLPEQSTS